MANKGKKGPRRGNRVHYWMCYRCDHRWSKVFESDGKHPPAPKKDEIGDIEYEPPKESCPNCHSKYNIRSILDAVEGKRSGKGAMNLDPFTGRDITDIVKEAENVKRAKAAGRN